MKNGLVVLLTAFLLLSAVIPSVDAQNHTRTNATTTIGRVMLVDQVENVRTVQRTLDPTLFVGSTEYEPFDPGKVFVQLINGSAQPIDNSSCFVDIYFPNGTIFVGDTLMMFLDQGIHEFNFLVPNVLGVHPVAINCIFETATEELTADAFIKLPGTGGGGDLSDLLFVDGQFLKSDEGKNGPFSSGLNISIPVTNFSDLNSLSLNLFVSWEEEGGDPPSDPILYSFKNFSDNSTFLVGTHDYTLTVQEFTFTFFGNISPFFNGSHIEVIIRDTVPEPTDTDNTHYHLDFLRLVLNRNQTLPVEEIRGGGEVHVRNSTAVLIQAINVPFRFGEEEVGIIFAILLFIGLFFIKKKAYWIVTGAYFVVFALSLWNTQQLGLTITLLGVGFTIGAISSFHTEW